ncbi:MAG: COG1615 family transporter [Rhodococcus sp.]|nr:COG1615 family transporter [Rhodococcus sp. (in: high G+C Gram-positive bacteria)]
MRPPTGIPSLSKRTKILLVLAAVVAVLLLLGPRLVDTYTNWLWFGSVDFRSVYVKVLMTRIVLFLVVGVFVGVVVWLALLLAYRSRPVFVPTAGPNDPVARYRTAVMTRMRTFGLGIPIVLGVLSGLIAQSSWVTVQMFFNGGSFGTTDPQFGLDVGFYAFDLPFYRFVLNWMFVAVIFAFLASLVTHYVFGGIRLAGRGGSVSTAARVQLAIMAGLFVAFKAVAYWLDRYELLWSGRKEPMFTGAGFTDTNAVLPAKMILMAIAVICALAFFAAIVLRDLRIPALATALLVLSSILVGAVYPLMVEQFSVRPNAADKEREYIERNIAATREAYGITDDVVTYEAYSGEGTVPPEEVPADITTIANTRLLDPNVLPRTFTQQTQLKNFYGYPESLDIDRYEVDGRVEDYIVAARELSPSSLTGNQTDWINRHTVYTHGNGLVAAPANRVNAAVSASAEEAANSNSGYPVYMISDLASLAADNQVIPVEQPRVYYGEVIAQADPDYAIVGGPEGSAPREYDTDTEKYTYTGEGGVDIGNWFNRLAFAGKYAERNILFSSAIGSDSKILFNRDPRDRVTKVAPWLTADGDVYPAAVDGRIVWIVDAYTTLDNYPYAQRSSLEGLVEDSIDQNTGRLLPRKEVSYIRNSVKATVDAYDGTVTLYQVDEQDPVLSAWMGVFPDAVTPKDQVSDELSAHFRYPEDLFKVQREMLAKYHVDDPREFFTNNAFWSVPADPTVDTTANQPPYYLLMGDETTAEARFRLTSAMVGYNRQFLSAYISVESDPENYGKFTILQLPTDTQTFGPEQTQNAMISDTRVASERTLLERSNRIHYGNLLTLPIAQGGILYVQPMYTERNPTAGSTSTFPQLSRVLVSYREPGSSGGVRIGYAPTLAAALDQVFGPGVGDMATAPGGEAVASAEVEDETRTETAEGAAPVVTPDGEAEAPAPSAPPVGRDAAIAELDSALEDLANAQRSGDFGQYGRALDRVQRAVESYQSSGG